MSEASVWRVVTVVLFTAAVAIAALTTGPTLAVFVLTAWMCWSTLSAATREEVRNVRRRTIRALFALRKRHDDELMTVWCRVHEKPAAEYVPAGLDAPRAMEQPDVLDVTQPLEPFPPTEPSGMPLAVQSALIAPVSWEQRAEQLWSEWQKRAAEIGGGR